MKTTLLDRGIAFPGVSCALMALLLALSSCVTSSTDLIILNDRIMAVDRRIDALEQRTDQKLSEEVDARLTSIYERQAEMGTAVDGIRQETQSLTGRMEENQHLIKRAVERDTMEQDALRAQVAELKERVAELETQVAQLRARQGLEPATGEAPPPAPRPATGEISRPPKEPPAPQAEEVSPELAVYEKALATFREGKYDLAISQFRGFIGKYPKSDLADNAQFWIGECHMSRKQYEQAILAYQDVIKNYPQGNKVPNAILRQAVAFAEIDDKTSARLLLKKVIKEYPNSSEARIAKTKLDTL